MTLTLPLSRNSFHPAWLLVPLPPLVEALADWYLPGSQAHPLTILRLLLSLALIAPLLWWRAAAVTPAVGRLLKELRGHLPGFLVAVVVPGFLGVAHDREMLGWQLVPFSLGSLLMGATAFGSEFEHRTMAGLLCQPISRARIYGEKLLILSALLAFAAANLRFGLALLPPVYGDSTTEQVAMVALFAVAVFAAAPLFSQLTRSTLAGLIFTVAAPMLLWLLIASLCNLGQRLLGPNEPLPDHWVEWVFKVCFPLYVLLCAGLSWRTFQRLEARDTGAAPATSGLHPLSRPVEWLLASLIGGSATSHLVRKELRLHVIPWLVAGIQVGLWLLWLAARSWATDEETRQALASVEGPFFFGGILGALTLLGTGAAAVAEERQLGTLEWQVTQPVSVRRQWRLKCAVTLLLGLLLGVALPLTLLRVGLGTEQFGKPFAEAPLIGYVVSAAGIGALLVISLFASSFARSTVKAVAAAVSIGSGLVALLFALGWMAGQLVNRGYLIAQEVAVNRPVPVPAWAPAPELIQGLAIGSLALSALLVLGLLVFFAGRNFAQTQVAARSVFRQLMVTVGVVTLLSLLAATTLAELSVLQHRANMAKWAEEMPRAMLRELKLRASRGNLRPEVFTRYGLASTNSAETLFEAMKRAAEPLTWQRFVSEITPPPPVPAGINATPARRYGLAAPLQATNKTGKSEASEATPGVPITVDPVLGERYRLTTPDNPPAP